MNWNEIPDKFPVIKYSVSVLWSHLEDAIERDTAEKPFLDLNPDFQRGHVWTEAQQRAYVEFILKGGDSGRTLYFNCPGWMKDFKGPYVIVDGKQRLEAARKFVRNELSVFNGVYLKDFDYKLPTDYYFIWSIAVLPTRKEVLNWYLDFNSAGTIHSQEELDKVRRMLENE